MNTVQMINRARHYHQSGVLQPAIAIYRQILEQDPTNVAGALSSGRGLPGRGRLCGGRGLLPETPAIAADPGPRSTTRSASPTKVNRSRPRLRRPTAAPWNCAPIMPKRTTTWV